MEREDYRRTSYEAWETMAPGWEALSGAAGAGPGPSA